LPEPALVALQRAFASPTFIARYDPQMNDINLPPA
jgi:hypothetical protein